MGLAGLVGVRPFFFPVGLDDPVVVLNAARLIEQAIGYRAIAARLVVAIEGIAFFLERLRLRSDRNLRLAVDPLLFQRARIVTDIEAGALHDLVEMIAPPVPQILGRRPGRDLPVMLLRLANVFEAGGRADNLASGVDIRVLEDDMRMRVLGWSVPRGYRSDNPCAHVKMIKGGEAYDAWTWEQITYFHENVTKPELWWAAALALYTGQRQGDCLAMRWLAVKGDMVSVTQQKTGKSLKILCIVI